MGKLILHRSLAKRHPSERKFLVHLYMKMKYFYKSVTSDDALKKTWFSVSQRFLSWNYYDPNFNDCQVPKFIPQVFILFFCDRVKKRLFDLYFRVGPSVFLQQVSGYILSNRCWQLHADASLRYGQFASVTRKWKTKRTTKWPKVTCDLEKLEKVSQFSFFWSLAFPIEGSSISKSGFWWHSGGLWHHRAWSIFRNKCDFQYKNQKCSMNNMGDGFISVFPQSLKILKSLLRVQCDAHFNLILNFNPTFWDYVRTIVFSEGFSLLSKITTAEFKMFPFLRSSQRMEIDEQRQVIDIIYQLQKICSWVILRICIVRDDFLEINFWILLRSA